MEEIPNGTYKIHWWSARPALPLEGIESAKNFEQVSLCDIKATPKTLTISFRYDSKLRLEGAEDGAYSRGTIRLTRKSPVGIRIWEKGKFTIYFDLAGIPTCFEWLP